MLCLPSTHHLFLSSESTSLTALAAIRGYVVHVRFGPVVPPVHTAAAASIPGFVEVVWRKAIRHHA